MTITKGVNIMRFKSSIDAGFLPTASLIEFLIKKHNFKGPKKEFRDISLSMLTFEGMPVTGAIINDHILLLDLEAELLTV